jgi:hypothetical protein
MERLRKFLEAIDDVLVDLDLARLDPGFEVSKRPVVLVGEIHHHEAVELEPLGDDQTGNAPRTVRRWRVVLGNGAATGDASVVLHVGEASLEDVAADIVEIYL